MAFANRGTQLTVPIDQAFRPSTPVNERECFSGRAGQLRALVEAVEQVGQHAIIFGERGVGKTSLANILTKHYVGRGVELIAPRVNCDLTDTYSTLWRKVFSEIQFARELRGKGFGAGNTFNIEALTTDLPDPLTPDSIRKYLTVLSRNTRLIVIIDEFDRLSHGEITALFADTIKTLSDHSVQATLVLVGVADSVDELLQRHESIERALVQVPVPRASKDEITQIIKEGINRVAILIDDDALELIALLAQGLPHYAHLLGLATARQTLTNRRVRVEVADVEAAVQKILNQAHRSVREKYLQATGGRRADALYPQVLLACALADKDERGYFTGEDMRRPISVILDRPCDPLSFARHLSEFTKRRGPVLQKVESNGLARYRFLNPLMQPYVTMFGVMNGTIGRSALRKLQTWPVISSAQPAATRPAAPVRTAAQPVARAVRLAGGEPKQSETRAKELTT